MYSQIYFICMGVLPACIYANYLCTAPLESRRLNPLEQESKSCEQNCMRWELNSYLLEELSYLSNPRNRYTFENH